MTFSRPLPLIAALLAGTFLLAACDQNSGNSSSASTPAVDTYTGEVTPTPEAGDGGATIAPQSGEGGAMMAPQSGEGGAMSAPAPQAGQSTPPGPGATLAPATGGMMAPATETTMFAQATPEAMAPATDGPALYDGSPQNIVSPEALLNPKGLVDRPIGGRDATVWLIEYASPTCPHCAAFHNETYPALKEQYIDTGQIVFLLRPFIRNALDAAVFMLAECSVDRYHEIIAGFFERQNEWAISQTPRDAILAVALDYGFTQETFDTCLNSQELFTQLSEERQQAIDEFGLTATPTFYMPGKTFTGAKPIADMQAEIDPLLQ